MVAAQGEGCPRGMGLLHMLEHPLGPRTGQPAAEPRVGVNPTITFWVREDNGAQCLSMLVVLGGGC